MSIEKALDKIFDRFEKRMLRTYRLEAATYVIITVVILGLFLFFVWKDYIIRW